MKVRKFELEIVEEDLRISVNPEQLIDVLKIMLTNDLLIEEDISFIIKEV